MCTNLEDGIIDLELELLNLERQIAGACSLLNAWARKLGIPESGDPYSNLELRNLVYRICEKVTHDLSQ